MADLDLPALAGVGLFLVIMLHAAVTDLMYRRIRNAAVAALAAAYLPLALLAGFPAMTLLASLAAAVGVFALGVGCFAAGWLGGGDVKLAAVAVLWLGAGLALPYLLLATLMGAGVILAILAARRLRRLRGPGRPLPYGPGLACAAALLIDRSPWFGASGGLA